MYQNISSPEFDEWLKNFKNRPVEPTPPKPEPAWHEGAIREPIKGMFEGVQDIVSHLSPYEYTPDPLKTNTLTLNPEETGWVGQIGHQLGHDITAFMVGRFATSTALTALAISASPILIGVGGATALALSFGRRVYENWIDEGLDSTTATNLGTMGGSIAGVTSVVLTPVRTLATAIASNVGLNISTSLVDKGTTKQILKNNGYERIADQIEMFDKTAIATDTLIGAFLGYTHYKHNNHHIDIKPKPSEVDMAMGAKRDIVAMHDLNSGVQLNNETSELYYRNFEKANEAFVKGEDFVMHPQEAEQLTQGTLFHQAETPSPILEKKDETFEQKIQALDDFSANTEASKPFRKDLDVVKSKIYETALSCFYEHGGK